MISEWLDLSHQLFQGMPRVALLPDIRVSRLAERPAQPMNITSITLPCHVGTHLDAPSHFIEGGRTISEIPLEDLYGEGVVWRISSRPLEPISATALRNAKPKCRDGDIVLLDTGWAEKWETTAYDDHPHLSVEAAQWLADRQVKIVGVDLPTPDLAFHERGEGFDWPVHRILLGNDVLIAEHLANLRPLAGKRIEAMILPINIRRSDGAPARAVGRALQTSRTSTQASH